MNYAISCSLPSRSSFVVMILLLLSVVAWSKTNTSGNKHAPKYPFLDPSLPWDVRVDDLVSRLTIKEIVAQSETNYGPASPAIPRLGVKPYVWITECLRGQVRTNTTAFPQALGLAATFR